MTARFGHLLHFGHGGIQEASQFREKAVSQFAAFFLPVFDGRCDEGVHVTSAGCCPFVRAARARGLLEMDWDDAVGDQRLRVPR